MSYYTKRPFLFVGLPFLSAVIFGTFLLADMRKTRYRTTAVEPRPESTTEKRTLKSLESELEVIKLMFFLILFNHID